MKVKEIKKVKQAGDELPGIDFRLALEDETMFMEMLSKMYAQPEKAIVQEYLSNCWDSHVRAGCTEKAIRVQLKKDTSGN